MPLNQNKLTEYGRERGRGQLFEGGGGGQFFKKGDYFKNVFAKRRRQIERQLSFKDIRYSIYYEALQWLREIK